MRLDQTLIDVVDEEMRLDGPHLLRPIMEQCAISLEGDKHIDQIDYEKLVEDGLARGLARIGLPLSLYTEWYWKIDLHNLFHFLKL